MQFLRSAWLLTGLFGCGAAVGLGFAIWIGRGYAEPRPGEWFEPLFRLFTALIGLLLIPLITGLVAAALGLAAKKSGHDKPLPYLAVLGNGFYLFLAGWIIRAITKR